MERFCSLKIAEFAEAAEMQLGTWEAPFLPVEFARALRQPVLVFRRTSAGDIGGHEEVGGFSSLALDQSVETSLEFSCKQEHCS